ncbi:unnamed protein product, partial [Brassica rapa]
MTSLAVCVCPCVSVSHTGRPCVSVSTHRTSVAVRDVRWCPPAHTGRPWLSVCVRVCPSAHIGRYWLSISTHISTLVHGLSTLALPMDCSGDFGPRGLSVQYTQDICVCTSAHTGRPCVTSVCVRQHTQDAQGCPCVSVSTHRILPISTHISMLVLGLSTLTLPVDCSGDFGPRGLSGQYTQDVRGCPPAHTGRPWLSVCVRSHTQDVRGCPSAHTGRSWLSVCVRVCPTSVCVRRVSVSTHGTSVAVHQYTYQHAVHTGRPWVSISTHRTSVGVRQYTQDNRGCPCVSVRTHMTSVAVHLYTYQHVGRWTKHANPSRGLTLVLGLHTLALPVDCLGDFGPRGLSVQYTQDVRGCPPTHTGRLWLSVSTHRTSVAVRVSPCVSVGVRQLTQDDIRVCPSIHISARWFLDSARWPFPWTVWYTQDIRGCPPTHTGRLWLSVAVRQHTQDVCGCPCVSVMSVCVRQHTQDIRGCPTSVAVHQYTYQHVGPWTQHAGPSRRLFGSFWPITHRTSVGVRQHTQDVRGCPWLSVSTHRTYVTVRVCPSAHTGRPWVSVSTHRTSVCVRQHTQDVRGCPCVSVCVRQHTLDIRGSHTGHLWVSVSTHRTSVCVCQHTQDVRGCPCVSVCV